MNHNVEQFERCTKVINGLEKLRNPAQLLVTVSFGKRSDDEPAGDTVEVELSLLSDLDGVINLLKKQVEEERARWLERARVEADQLRTFLGESVIKS